MIEQLAEAMNKAQVSMKKIQENSEHSRLNLIDLGYQYMTLDSSRIDEINSLYQSFQGKSEFLYCPPRSEIEKNMNSQNVSYLGMQNKYGELVGVIKVEKLSVPSPFFMPPQYDNGEDSKFYGMSGLIISDDYRKQGLAKYLTKTTLNALHIMGATGVYADCDYRNKGSFATISKMMDFVGFADARFGAENEKTVYMTFYSSKDRHQDTPVTSLKFDFSQVKGIDDVVEILQSTIDKLGGSDSLKIDYGKKELGEYNTLYVLRNRVRTADVPPSLVLAKEEEHLTAHNDNDLALKLSTIISLMQRKQGRM